MRPGQRALALLFLLTLPLLTPRIRAADEIQYYASLRSLVFDHDLDFGNEYLHFYERDPAGLAGFKATFLDRREPGSGRHINFAPLGAAFLWSPFFLLAHGGVWLLKALGASVPADGFSYPYLAAVSFASAIYAFAGLLLIHDLLLREGKVGEPAAAGTVAALWLATPVLYYMTIAPGFGHAPSLFAVSLLVWLFFRARALNRVRDWVFVGLSGGLCGFVREQDALFLVLPAGFLAWEALGKGAWRESLPRAGALALGTAVALVPQLIVYRLLTGAFGPSKLVTRKMTLTSPHFLEVLADPAHGLFFWSPILLLAAFGLAAFVRTRRDSTATFLALAFLAQVWINGSIESWHLAGAFGSRRFVAATPLLSFGLALALQALAGRWGARLSGLVVLFFVWWNLSLMAQFGLKLMDRQGLEWPKVAVNQVSAVPRHMGRALWLFLTDRERLAKEGP